MTDTNYFEEKLRSMAIEKYTKENKKLIAAQINEQSQKVNLQGLYVVRMQLPFQA